MAVEDHWLLLERGLALAVVPTFLVVQDYVKVQEQHRFNNACMQ